MPAAVLRLLCAAVGTLSVAAAMLLASPVATAAVATPSSFRVATSGQYNTGVRVQWTWRSGISRYDLQVSTSSSFASPLRTLSVPGRSTRPSSGVMAVTVPELPNATRLWFRVRARTGTAKSSWSGALATATKVGWPGKFGSVSARPGPGAGELTFTWQHDGSYTSFYQLETALTLFSKTASSGLPATGRESHLFTISRTVRSYTLTAEQVAEAGAAAGSGNHLLFRFYAVNRGTAGEQIRRYPYLQAVMPVPGETHTASGTPKPGTSSLRAASFNVRTAKATTDARSWLDRKADVADAVIAEQPDVVALQELGPGRADGQDGPTTGTVRQTTSLLQALAAHGAGRYRLVRSTPYVAPGTTHGSQGTRILYDSSSTELLSDCPDATGSSNYSSSCSVELPLLAGDSASRRRTAAYAEFRLRATGQRFWMVSAHLDDRHDDASATEATYNGLRGRQMATILRTVAALNDRHDPVVLGGDLNSWQNIAVGNAPHDALVDAGFFDSASAPRRVNLRYSTYNDFALTQPASGVGFAARLDGVYVSQGTATRFENVTQVTDSTRPSDHNLVVADLVVGG